MMQRLVQLELRALLAGTLLVGGSSEAAGQRPPVRTLATGSASIAEPFTRVDAVRELRDGRLVVLDTRDRALYLVDPRSRDVRQLGRAGSGPREYLQPLAMFAIDEGRTIVRDPSNGNRLLIIEADGTLGDFLRLPDQDNDATSPGRSEFVPFAADTLGRYYTQGQPTRRATDGRLEPVDSISIERLDERTGQRDTVAFMRLPPDPSRRIGTTGRTFMRPLGPFSAQPMWTVAPDGILAILEPEPYRITLVDGARAVTTTHPVERVRVSEAHKEEWREARRQPVQAVTMRPGEDRTTPRILRPRVPEPAEWPEYLPPFLGKAALFAPDGRLWVQRTTEAGAPPAYDVVDRAGRNVERVLLPARSRVAGFGNGSIYLVTVDDVDLEHLYRVPMPR